MKIILATAIITLFLLACSKDKLESKPRLEFAGYNKTVDPGGALTIRINYFDKEGDIDETSFTAIKNRLNEIPPGNNLGDTFLLTTPAFPPKDKGEITFQLDYSRLDEDDRRSDTIRFKFAVTDKKGNNSDTITTETIIVRQP